jgi:TonB family protein
MNNIVKRTIALATFALAASSVAGLATAASTVKTPHGQSAPAVTPDEVAVGNGARRQAWAVLRVSVTGNGNVDAIRLAYTSGNPAFNKSALQAVSKTTFVPEARKAGAATFDYLLMVKNGQRQSRIMAHAPGDAQTSTVASVRVPRDGNAWLSNVDACQLSQL